MKNMIMEVKDNKLTITIDLTEEQGMSKSGKSMVIATTSGNVSIPENDDIKIGLNIYKSV